MDGSRPSLLSRLGGCAIVPVVIVGGLGLALLGVLALNHLGRDSLAISGQATVALVDIDCSPPPGRSQEDFLREVGYQSGLPAQLSLLEPGLAERLAQAFAKHPYVARVEHIEVAAHQIHVRLTYRTAVLAVIGTQQSFQVDEQGIHLGPVNDQSLPVYHLPTRETTLRAAARTAAFLRPDQDILKLRLIEGPASRLELEGAWPGRVIWGHAPGKETAGEQSAENKRQRLLRLVRAKENMDVDLRRAE